MEMNVLDKVSYTLLVLGGLVWGSIGVFEKNPVAASLSDGPTKVVYVLYGLAAVYGLYSMAKMMSAQKKSSK